jgi:hypothetical protein
MISAVTLRVFPPVKEEVVGGEAERFAGLKWDRAAAVQIASASSSDKLGPASIIHCTRGTSAKLDHGRGGTGKLCRAICSLFLSNRCPL